jgi:predicted secreted hydrolase
MENFRRYVNVSAYSVAQDLAALLNRAHDLGIAICPDVDSEGISYSIEWVVNGEARDLDVEPDPSDGRYTFVSRKAEPKESDRG